MKEQGTQIIVVINCLYKCCSYMRGEGADYEKDREHFSAHGYAQLSHMRFSKVNKCAERSDDLVAQLQILIAIAVLRS